MQSRKPMPALPVPDPCLAAPGAQAARAISALHRRADPPGWSLDSWRNQLAQDSVFAVTVGGPCELLAFAALSLAAGEAEILMIAVDPAARAQGAGRRTLHFALEQARLRGAERCFLEVAADNAPALALYRRAGFSDIAVRKGYYARGGHAVDAYVMTRPLVPAAPDAAGGGFL